MTKSVHHRSSALDSQPKRDGTLFYNVPVNVVTHSDSNTFTATAKSLKNCISGKVSSKQRGLGRDGTVGLTVKLKRLTQRVGRCCYGTSRQLSAYASKSQQSFFKAKPTFLLSFFVSSHRQVHNSEQMARAMANIIVLCALILSGIPTLYDHDPE